MVSRADRILQVALAFLSSSEIPTCGNGCGKLHEKPAVGLESIRLQQTPKGSSLLTLGLYVGTNYKLRAQCRYH